jgi:hypothetical protein
VDRILLCQLRAIARDRHSGAAELALRASRHVQEWLAAPPGARGC